MKKNLISIIALAAFAMVMVFNFQAIQDENGSTEISAFTIAHAQSIDPPETNCVSDWSAQGPNPAVSTLVCWTWTGPNPNTYGCGYRNVATRITYSTCP